MFLEDTILASYGISMLYHLLTYLYPSTSENLILAISNLPRLEMGLGESSIVYMLHVRGISQQMQGVTMG